MLMWRSYHIYTSNRKMFLQILDNLQNEYYNSKFFFVQYVDPIGFHFRLRVQSVEQQNIELKINEYFGNIRILKKVYDPEYTLFMDSLPIYEEYSVELTKFLVSYRDIPPHSYIEDIIKMLLEHFRCNNINFIQFYMSYWQGYARFQNKTQQENLRQQLSRSLESPPFTNVISILYPLEEQHLNKEICFKFLHMTLNKFGFSIMDELVILSNYLEQHTISPQK